MHPGPRSMQSEGPEAWGAASALINFQLTISWRLAANRLLGRPLPAPTPSSWLSLPFFPEPTPAPAEPCDISTYKNLQHHDYGTYTFLDLNLDLSKFRMPQPSSGRASPRH